MDELEIGGKRYISSRRAAKEHKYHIDYIGQLIRAGRVMGKKVGRSWYVEEQSLNVYLKQEAGDKSYIAPAQAVEEEIVKEEAPTEVREAPTVPVIEEVVSVALAEDVQEIISVSAPEEPEVTLIVEEKEEERIVLAPEPEPIRKVEQEEQKINVIVARKETIQKTASTLTYIEDKEPLLPVLEGRQRKNADFVAVSLRRNAEIAPEEEINIESSEEGEENEELAEDTSTAPSRIRAALALGVVGILVLIVVAAGSSLLALSINISDGKAASVSLTIK